MEEALNLLKQWGDGVDYDLSVHHNSINSIVVELDNLTDTLAVLNQSVIATESALGDLQARVEALEGEVPEPEPEPEPDPDPDPEPEPEPDPEPEPEPEPEPTGEIPYKHNTGPRVDLTRFDGRLLVKEDNAVVEGLHVVGYIDIKANNVTVRDCYVEYSGDAYALRTYDGFGGTTVEHTKITMAQSAKANGGVMGGRDTTVRYCDISGHGDGIKAVPNGTYEYNWIHMSKPTSSDKHLDAIQGGHNNTLIRGNLLWVPYSDGGNAAYINTTFADTPPNNVVITGNWIAGGTFAVYIEPTKQGDCMTNVELSNNKFAPTHRWGRYLTRECTDANVFGNTDWPEWDQYGDAEVWASN